MIELILQLENKTVIVQRHTDCIKILLSDVKHPNKSVSLELDCVDAATLGNALTQMGSRGTTNGTRNPSGDLSEVARPSAIDPPSIASPNVPQKDCRLSVLRQFEDLRTRGQMYCPLHKTYSDSTTVCEECLLEYIDEFNFALL